MGAVSDANVRVSFTYNAAAQELEDIADERGLRAQDLFDWIAVQVPESGSTWVSVWDCECA
jgi:hypothetical protein